MTEENIALLELAEKHADGDFLRELGEFTLQRLMDLEAQAACGAERNERSAERVNQRNGYRQRQLETRIGTMALKVPKLRLPIVLEAAQSVREGTRRGRPGGLHPGHQHAQGR